MSHPPTIFCDIDGTIFAHKGDLFAATLQTPELLPNVVLQFNEWEHHGCRIILVTGRRESQRERTEAQLRAAGIFYDQLIMGIGGGPRILVNDRKPDGTQMAFAVNLDRNCGFNL